VSGRVPADLDGAAVAADGLVKTYRSRAGTVDAVRGVDLRVQAGEVFGFLGPNGAGQSTTVRMLTTLLSLTSGTARVPYGMRQGRVVDPFGHHWLIGRSL
jgi:ABC-2 type transport system ATP-binding protein